MPMINYLKKFSYNFENFLKIFFDKFRLKYHFNIFIMNFGRDSDKLLIVIQISYFKFYYITQLLKFIN